MHVIPLIRPSLFRAKYGASARSFRYRVRRRQRPIAAAVLLIYSLLLAYMIPRHEPWADEAQAWELAKSLGLKSLFNTYLHYEASPGLWHGLLWLLARMHVGYVGMHWAVAAIALLAMMLLVFASSFPLPVRLMLPFTYFFAYQYCLIARSYSLFPPVLFALAYTWKQRQDKPMRVMVLLGLLANTSVHGLAIAAGLALVLAVEWWPARRYQGARGKAQLRAVILFLLLAAFAIWCLRPPQDADWVHGMTAHRDPAKFAAMVHTLALPYPWLNSLPLSIELAIGLACRFLLVIGQGLSDRFLLGLVLWILLAWYWQRTGRLRYALPVLSLGVLSTLTRFDFYHAGLFWVLLIFLLWVTWSEQPTAWIGLRRLVWLLFLVCIVVQLRWTIRAIRYERAEPYSANRDGAVILQDYLRRGYRVDVAVPARADKPQHGEFFVTGLEPYFADEPIQNMRARFWIWSADAEMRAKYLDDTQRRSVAVIVEESPDDPRYHLEEFRLNALGYQRGETVCGEAFYPDGMGPLLCHAFYEPHTL